MASAMRLQGLLVLLLVFLLGSTEVFCQALKDEGGVADSESGALSTTVELTKLKAELSSALKEKSILEAAVKGYKHDLAQSEEASKKKIEALEADLKKQKKEVKEQKREIAALEQEMGIKIGEVEMCSTNKALVLAAQQAEAEAKESQAANVEKIIALEADLKKQKMAVKEQKREIAALEKEMLIKIEEMETCSTDKTVLLAAQQAEAACTSELTELKTEQSASSKKIAALESDLKKQKKEVKERKREIAALEQELDIKIGEAGMCSSQMRDLMDKHEERSMEQATSTAEVEKMKIAMDKATMAANKSQAELADAHVAANQAKQQLEERLLGLVDKTAELQRRAEAAEKLVENQKHHHKQVSSSVQEAAGRAEAAEAALRVAEAEAASLKRSLSGAEAAWLPLWVPAHVDSFKTELHSWWSASAAPTVAAGKEKVRQMWAQVEAGSRPVFERAGPVVRNAFQQGMAKVGPLVAQARQSWEPMLLVVRNQVNVSVTYAREQHRRLAPVIRTKWTSFLVEVSPHVDNLRRTALETKQNVKVQAAEFKKRAAVVLEPYMQATHQLLGRAGERARPHLEALKGATQPLWTTIEPYRVKAANGLAASHAKIYERLVETFDEYQWLDALGGPQTVSNMATAIMVAAAILPLLMLFAGQPRKPRRQSVTSTSVAPAHKKPRKKAHKPATST